MDRRGNWLKARLQLKNWTKILIEQKLINSKLSLWYFYILIKINQIPLIVLCI